MEGNNTTVTFTLIVIETYILIPFYFFWSCTYILLFLFYAFHPQDLSSPYYIIVKGLALCDVLQLLSITYNSLYEHTNYTYLSYLFGEILDMVFVTLQFSSEFSSYAFHLSLSINRFVAIVYFHRYKQIFNQKVTYSLVLLCFGFGFLTFCPTVMLKLFHFYPYHKFWFFQGIYPYDIMDKIFSRTTSILITFISCFACVYSFFKLAKIVNHRTLYKLEIKMLIQSILMSLILVIEDLAFYLQEDNIPSVMTRFSYFIYAGVNPVIILSMDKNVRKHLLIQLKRCYTVCFPNTHVSPLPS